MEYARLTDAKLRNLAAEIGPRVEQRKSTLPTGCARASGALVRPV
jgi:hypothetical protein